MNEVRPPGGAPGEEDEDGIEWLPSKTQLKREAHQLVELGIEITQMKKADIDSLDLPDELYEAVTTAMKIRSGSGLKRQRQYIGKLLRNLDHDSIRARVETIRHRHDTNTAAFKRLESWRDRLLQNDKQVLGEILAAHPGLDRQHVHQLVRQAHKEAAAGKAPASARKLFRYLRELSEG